MRSQPERSEESAWNDITIKQIPRPQTTRPRNDKHRARRGTMAAIEQGFLQTQLEERRHRLQHALETAPQEAILTQLLADVDAALTRMTNGTYGICEACHEPVEKERLLADPLICYCLDHLPEAQKRALEQDLELATRVQRGLLP